ncbi:MAG: hypothetical protein J7507_08075 [Pseudoxanthomonas sp.]|nr:hypothetical protein [Pseudoxanthomonas sp.]
MRFPAGLRPGFARDARHSGQAMKAGRHRLQPRWDHHLIRACVRRIPHDLRHPPPGRTTGKMEVGDISGIQGTRLMKSAWLALVVSALVALPASAQVPTGKMGELRPDQKRFFELYKELVETDTSITTGSCTTAAAQIATRLKAAGFTDEQITLFSVPDHPKEGGIVAVFPGTSDTLKPILLLAHIDVVTAKRAD